MVKKREVGLYPLPQTVLESIRKLCMCMCMCVCVKTMVV